MKLVITATYLPENEVLPWMISCLLDRQDGNPETWFPFNSWHEAFAFFVQQDWSGIEEVRVRWSVASERIM